MFEMEIKLKIKNLAELRTQLTKLEHKHPLNLTHVDRYYNLPLHVGDFAKTDEALRLRSSTEINPISHEILMERHDLTYKGPKLDQTVKSRIEHVSHILAPVEMDNILLALGYRKVLSVEKQREVHEVVFKDHPIECLIDRVEHLKGVYFEAEIVVPSEQDMPATKKNLIDFIRYLGYSESDTIVESYLELVIKSLKR